jgi:hypothetical protein
MRPGSGEVTRREARSPLGLYLLLTAGLSSAVGPLAWAQELAARSARDKVPPEVLATWPAPYTVADASLEGGQPADPSFDAKGFPLARDIENYFEWEQLDTLTGNRC